MAEYEKKLHAGDDFSKSIRNVMDAQQNSFSKNFPKVKKLPGIVRSFQEVPFKMTLGNYDQCRLGAEYFNKTENSFVCLDSSGKFWADRQKKNEPKKLNSALVIPPIEKGQSPFPIFEQISQYNTTIDFLGFLQHAWHNMGIAVNNQEVKYPTVIISDISFANFHSALQFFNQLKIKEYLKIAYKSLINQTKLPVATILTICESHLLPAMLKTSRGALKDKVIGDTFIAGLMVMLQAKDFHTAYDIWKNLVKVHCSKSMDKEAQDKVTTHSYKNAEQSEHEENLADFENHSEEPEEIVKYGKREAIRTNSPFFLLFNKVIEKIENEEVEIEDVSNPFFCPQLIKLLCKQYLSLFPLISASVLCDGAGGGLRNNAYVELYWQEQRRIFSKIPKRLLWPPMYLGTLHEEMQRKATEIITRKFIPNIRTGGKARNKAASFVDRMEDDDDLNIFKPTPSKKKKPNKKKNASADDLIMKTVKQNPASKPKNTESGRITKQTKAPHMDSTKTKPKDDLDHKVFKPKPASKKTNLKPKESFNESFETWDSKKPREIKKTNSTYIKDKVIDYTKIQEANIIKPMKRVVVSGPGTAAGEYPQEIVISEERLSTVLTKNVYIDNEIVDAALSLIDRKLSEDCKYIEGVHIYNNTALRLIMSGAKGMVKDGSFLAILPRKLNISEENAQIGFGTGEKRARSVLDIGHFTLISNIHCGANEVNVFETLPAYRRRAYILTEEQKKLLKTLTKCENNNLKINCVNVCPQTEAECGAISFGLGVKLCFTAPEERSIFESFVDARRDFVECLKLNDLVNFESRNVENRLDNSDVLFSINI